METEHGMSRKLHKTSVFKISVMHSNLRHQIYEGWNFNSGNYLFTTDTK